MKYIIFILLITLNFSRASESGMSISFGPVTIGENRLPINLNDFKILVKSSRADIKAHLIPKSTQWVRMSNNLLTPRARLHIELPPIAKIHLQYAKRSIIPLYRGKFAESEIYVSLFDPADIYVYSGQNLLATIEIHSHSTIRKSATHVIDYSCSRYNIQIEGLDQEYLSVGCSQEVLGEFGAEYPRVELNWASPNFRLPGSTLPPYLVTFNQSGTIQTKVIDKKGKTRTISISATLPKRFHRLKTALGLGPYSFKSEYNQEIRSGRMAPAIMLYGKLELPQNTSIRMFDALIAHQSIFNNFGFYFAYQMASAFDNHISLVPLLGIQGLTYKYDKTLNNYTEIIYPQGFEVVYRNAFGLENYSLVYGMFISLTDSEIENYKNIWVRFGKRIFWEINYIDWRSRDKHASMWGLSVGFPFLSLF